MFGRKTMTPPTPLMIPPTSNSRREPSGIRPVTQSPSHCTPASIHSAGMPPSENVVWKVIHISSRKMGSPQIRVRHHAVDSVGRDMLLPCISGAIGFFEGAGDKSVLGIRDDRFGGFSVAVLELSRSRAAVASISSELAAREATISRMFLSSPSSLIAR